VLTGIRRDQIARATMAILALNGRKLLISYERIQSMKSSLEIVKGSNKRKRSFRIEAPLDLIRVLNEEGGGNRREINRKG